MDDDDTLHVMKALADALIILEQMYDYDPRKYNVRVEIAQCYEAIKIMRSTLSEDMIDPTLKTE